MNKIISRVFVMFAVVAWIFFISIDDVSIKTLIKEFGAMVFCCLMAIIINTESTNNKEK